MEGFSFPCASTAKPDATLKDFLKADRQSVVNPFPLLACRQNFGQDRTNPLVKLHYWVTSDLEDSLGRIDKLVEFGHEHEHMSTNYTPAKRLAQYLEGAALQRVDELLMAETWDTETEKTGVNCVVLWVNYP
jgi:hypothetical protein